MPSGAYMQMHLSNATICRVWVVDSARSAKVRSGHHERLSEKVLSLHIQWRFCTERRMTSPLKPSSWISAQGVKSLDSCQARSYNLTILTWFHTSNVTHLNLEQQAMPKFGPVHTQLTTSLTSVCPWSRRSATLKLSKVVLACYCSL